MRKLLFNFWNTDEKKMYRDFEFEDMVAKGGFTDNGIWLQWTGLLDKNRVRIYEGDIVGYWGNKTDGYITWRVLWDKNKSAFRFGNDVTNFTMTELKKKEVIGNIYENEGLLNK